MDRFDQESPAAPLNQRASTTLAPDRRLERQRSALLSGLLLPGQAPSVSPGLAEVIEHRERRQTTQTMELAHLMAQEPEREQTQRLQAPSPKASIRIQPPALPTAEPSAPPESSAPAAGALPPAEPTKPSFWQQLFSRLRPRRVPVLLQLSAVECGAACLAMLISYYGRKTAVAEVRQRCQVGRDGLSALDIVKAARSYGLRVRAVSLQEDDLSLISLPAIVHWEFNHFLIVERASANWVEVVDPAVGRRRLTMEEFFNGFTGVVLMLEPGTHFERAAGTQRITLGNYVRSYLKLAPGSIAQILGASLLLQLLGLALPLLTAFVVDQVLPFRLSNLLALLSIGLLIVIVAQVVLTLLRSALLLYLQTRVDTSMMLGFFEQLIALPLGFFQQRSSGDLLSRLGSNLVIRDTVSNQLLSTLLDGSFVVVYLLILFLGSPFFGVVALALGLVQAGILLASSRPIRRLSKQELFTEC